MNQTVSSQVRYVVDSFWTAKQRQGHSLHEISYRACFKPQLPAYFIKRFSRVGDVVLDPFMGRGTTALQATLESRVAYSSDINPLAEILTRPRLEPPSLTAIANRLKIIPNKAYIPVKEQALSVFFHHKTLSHLIALKKWFAKRTADRTIDKIDRWIRMVVVNRLTGHSPGFLSVKTMPPNQAVSIEKQQWINEQNHQCPEEKDLVEIVLKKSRSLLRSGYPQANRRCKLACCPADQLSYINNGEVSLVVTSPPFLDIVDYAKDNWLRCWFSEIDVNTIQINCYRTVEAWKHFVHNVFKELSRVVKVGGHVAFEVGDVRKGKVMLDKEVLNAIKGLPFKPLEVIINQQSFTKTSNCWGVTNNQAGTLTNRIVVVQRR